MARLISDDLLNAYDASLGVNTQGMQPQQTNIQSNNNSGLLSNDLLDAYDASLQKSYEDASDRLAKNPPKEIKKSNESILSFLKGAGQSIADLPVGIAGKVFTTFPSLIGAKTDEEKTAVRKAIADYEVKREQEYQNETKGSISAGAGRVAGAVAIPIPGFGALGAIGSKILPNAPKIIQSGVNLGGKLAGYATLGALNPVTQQTSNYDEYLDAVKSNAGLGAILGGAGEGVGKIANYGISKFIKGKLPENITQQNQALKDEGLTKATVGDITQSPILGKTETLTENIPFGLSKEREALQKQINQSAEGRLVKSEQDLSNIDYEDIDRLVKATEPNIGESTYVVKPIKQQAAQANYIDSQLGDNSQGTNRIGKSPSTDLRTNSTNLQIKQNMLGNAKNSANNFNTINNKNVNITGNIEEIPGLKTYDKRAREAEKLLENIYQAGDDPNRVLQASIQAKSLNNKIKADELYNDVEHAVNELGNPKININNTLSKVNSLLTNKNVIIDKKLDSVLIQIKNNLGKSPKYNKLREFRSDLNDLIKQGTLNQNALVGNRAVNGYKQILTALEADLKQFTGQNFKLDVLAQKADHFYKNNVIPFKAKSIVNIINNENPDTIINALLQSKSKDKLSNIVNRIDEKGRLAIKYSFLNNAVEQSRINATDNISPVKLAGYLEKYNKPISGLGEDVNKEFKGYAKLLRSVQRAGQYTENPPTGQRNLLGGLVGIGAVDPITAVNILASSTALRYLTTTETGKKLLLQAFKTRVNDPKMTRIIRKITERIALAETKRQQVISKSQDNNKEELTPLDYETIPSTNDELQPLED